MNMKEIDVIELLLVGIVAISGIVALLCLFFLLVK